MHTIERNEDIILGEKDLENIYSFKNFPINMGCTDGAQSDDVFFDMNWQISKSSGMIQLNPLLPLDIVYNTHHGSGTIGKVWKEHHKQFALFIKKYNVKKVLEIGGLHGILAENYFELDNDTKWTLIDPNPKAMESNRLRVLKGFFDSNFKSVEKYDSIIHSHVFEHIYNVHEFMNSLSNYMEETQFLIFSVPNLKKMLECNYTNPLNFEHTIYITEPYIEFLLNKYNFKLVEKEYFGGTHSIFYSAIKVEKKLETVLPKNLYIENKIQFENYIKFHLADVKKLNEILQSTSQEVFLFGAHIFSQMLINLGLKTDKIICILDNDVNKDKKRLYGTNLISRNPIILKQLSNPLVILRAGAYNDEIKNDILMNINKNVIFV